MTYTCKERPQCSVLSDTNASPDLDDVLQIVKPEPDSHYRLVPCPECGDADNAAFLQYQGRQGDRWRVACFTCGNTVDIGTAENRHAAQVAWNNVAAHSVKNPAVAG